MLMTVGETGNFLAYGFAPASIVSPLGVVALISNCVIAPIMLKEIFRWRDFWGVVVAVAGAVTVVLSARQQEKKLGPHEVWGAITTTEFEIYMGVTFGLIGVLAWASPRYGSRTILIDLGLVGLFGGYTALSTKGVASMLSSTLWKAFTTPVTYGLLAVLIITAVMQVKYVNKALQRFDSTQVIPVQFVMFTISVIMGSAILYRDFESATAESISKFIGGCLLTFFGVWLITSGRHRHDEDSDADSEDGGNERIILADQEQNDASMHYHDNGTLRRYHNGSHGTDDENDQSRRSSRVSFAPEVHSRPQTPSIRVTPSESAATLRTSLGAEPALHVNPWKESHDELMQATRSPLKLQATSSSPFLPSEVEVTPGSASTFGHEESLNFHVRSNSQSNPYTHPNLQQGGPPQADTFRPVTPARHSLSRSMMPGPLISPLSSGLSAVVADTLRRGIDKKGSFRRPRLGIKRTKSGNSRTESGDEADLSASPTKHLVSNSVTERFGSWIGMGSEGRDVDDELEQGPGSHKRVNRSRSLSNALGGFLTGKRQRTDDGEDNVAGPSGNVGSGD